MTNGATWQIRSSRLASVATAVAGVGGCLFALFGPTYATSSSTTSDDGATASKSSTQSLIETDPEPLAMAAIVIAGLASLVPAVVACRWNPAAGRRAGWGAAAVLLVFSAAFAPTVGLILAPAALLAVAAAVPARSAVAVPG